MTIMTITMIPMIPGIGSPPPTPRSYLCVFTLRYDLPIPHRANKEPEPRTGPRPSSLVSLPLQLPTRSSKSAIT